MTAKEKAKELVDKYQYAIRFDESETQYFANMNSVKECALIAVDEIIYNMYNNYEIVSYEYWNKVKQEIKLLCESN
jgi:hypothetical protein